MFLRLVSASECHGHALLVIYYACNMICTTNRRCDFISLLVQLCQLVVACRFLNRYAYAGLRLQSRIAFIHEPSYLEIKRARSRSM
jgi:hypothetical protein